MIEDRPPDEALDARLYEIDMALAALRSNLADLRALDAAEPGVFAADALAEYVRWIEQVIEHALAAQPQVTRR